MLVIVGRILRPHGLRGEVVVDVRTDEPETRFAVGSVLITDPAASAGQKAAAAPASPYGQPVRVPERLIVESARWHQNRLLVVFEGFYDRNFAEVLRGVLVYVDSTQVSPPADPDEFNDFQLIGLTAVNPAGDVLGEITGIDHAPASDLLVLRRPEGRTALIPFVKAIVPEVDLAGRRVVVDPPAGLLDL
ncbi:MAG TPA: ribosome maturation factor RimM [Micromonosporaceae bacterium]|nr:ribosome maturation factor RimM [Micromonosporaceae bacterium]